MIQVLNELKCFKTGKYKYIATVNDMDDVIYSRTPIFRLTIYFSSPTLHGTSGMKIGCDVT